MSTIGAMTEAARGMITDAQAYAFCTSSRVGASHSLLEVSAVDMVRTRLENT